VVRPQGTEPPARIAPNFKRLAVSDQPGQGSVRPHRHMEHEVILVDEGAYACSVNGTWMDPAPAEGVVVKPGDWHEDRFDGPVRYFGLVFTLEDDPLRPAPPGIFLEGVAPAGQRFRVARDKIWPLVRGIQQEGEAADRVSAQVQDALLLAFFWRMIRSLPVAAVNPRFLDVSGDQAFPAQLLRLFRGHINENLSVRDMAELLCISESSLAHRCTSLMGASPHKAFLKCRMERAQYLLANTDLSVKEVAAELGFEDPYSFSRAFKTVCGVSPTHWRER